MASRGPVVLGIDDLQWCDPTSYAALEYAVHWLGDDRVSVLAACRPGVRRRFVRSRRVDVSPLPEDDVSAVAQNVLGSHAGQSMVRQIAAVSGGNPLFARELARAAASGLSDWELPSSLRQVLKDRLAAVGPATWTALLDVAVRGAPGTHEADIGDLGEARDAELLKVADGRIMFTHPLLASAVLESATAEEVTAAHRRAAEVAADPVARALHRAHSSQAGDDVAAELDHAAEIALRRADLAGARLLARLAVELTPGRQAPASRLVQLARLETAFDDYQRAAELGHEILQMQSSPHEQAQALMAIAYLRLRSDAESAVDILRQAAAIDGIPEADAQKLTADIADMLYESGHPEQAITELEEFLGRLPAPTAEHSDIVAVLSLIRRFSGIHDDGTLLRNVIESGQVQDPMSGIYTTAAVAVVVAAIVATLADRHDEARRLLAQAEQSAARSGEKDTAGYFNGLLAYRTGDLAAAEREIRRTLSTDDSNPLGWARLALVEAWMGSAAQAMEHLREARVIQTTPTWHRQNAEISYAAAFVDLLAGRYADAWPVLRETAELLDAVGYREPSHPPVLPAAVEAAAAVGELDAAETLCARLERDAARLQSRFGAAAARRSRGFLAQARHDPGTAELCFAEAGAAFEAAGLTLEAARCFLALGALQRRLRQRRRARDSLETAQRIFASGGALGLQHDAEAELRRISGRAAVSPTQLTESERQVAGLVAQGLRNADVARTLHLSVKTVETHLGHVYRKLGMTNRNELIATYNRPMEG